MNWKLLVGGLLVVALVLTSAALLLFPSQERAGEGWTIWKDPDTPDATIVATAAAFDSTLAPDAGGSSFTAAFEGKLPANRTLMISVESPDHLLVTMDLGGAGPPGNPTKIPRLTAECDSRSGNASGAENTLGKVGSSVEDRRCVFHVRLNYDLEQDGFEIIMSVERMGDSAERPAFTLRAEARSAA